MRWQCTLAVVSIAAAIGATIGPSQSQEGGGAVRNPAAGKFLAPPDQVIAIRAGRMFDSKSGAILNN